MWVPSPTGANKAPVVLLPSAVVAVAFRFLVLNYTPSLDQGMVVRVPQTVAVFMTSTGNLRVFVPSKNITVVAPGYTNAALGEASIPVQSQVQFNTSNFAIFSSQLLSVMTTLPWNTVSLQFQWEWIFTEPNGTPQNSPWGGAGNLSQTVVPDEIVALASTSARTMPSGRPFTACISGPVEGRTFSLHAETVNGPSVNDFVQVNATVPTLTALPYCWSAAIPSWVTPQTILVHIWDYQNPNATNVTTLLLYLIPVKIVNATIPHSNTLLGIPVTTWLTGTTAAVGAVAVALVVLGLYRSRSRRGDTGGSVPETAGPSGGGGATGSAETAPGRRGPRNQ